MAGRKKEGLNETPRRAQAIVELAVFGAIFLFIVGAIIQQGFSTMSYQQTQLQSLRQALLASYQGGQAGSSKRNSASVLVFEDRLAPGFSKYGAVDRVPSVSSGSGSMSRNLYMPTDWDDVDSQDKINVLDLRVNGQSFELTTAGSYNLKVTRNMVNGRVDMVPAVNEDARKRLEREWNEKCPPGIEVACYPYGYTISARGNANFTGNDDWQYDYNRNGDNSDDLWQQSDFVANRGSLALWKWVRDDLSAVQGKINTADGDYPAYDITGDSAEESIFSISLEGTNDHKISFNANIADVMAGDTSSEDPSLSSDPGDRQGMKQDASVISRQEDGTVMEIRSGKAYIPGTNELSRSVAMKRQFDVISRTYQLNRKMANPDSFVGRNIKDIEVSCPDGKAIFPPSPVGRGGCCMSAANVIRTCFDKNTRTLYIRSRISDTRGRKWVNRADAAAEKALVGAP